MFSDCAINAKQKLEEIISFMGINANAEITENEDGILLSIDNGLDTARLIGHHGETLRAIEYLTSQVVRNTDREAVRINVDIAGYRTARKSALEEKARECADKALATGREQVMRPMNSAERRIVHMAIQDLPGVKTESRGEGGGRRVVVLSD